MKIIEFITATIFIIGLVFKLLNWPGSFFFITISLTTLSYYYFIFSFALFNDIKIKDILLRNSYKNKSLAQIILSIFLGMSVSIILTGIMYVLNNWATNINFIITGIISTTIVLISYYILNKDMIKNWRIVFLRSIILVSIGLLIYFKFILFGSNNF